MMNNVLRRFTLWSLVVVALALSAFPMFAQSIDIDPTPIFTGINDNLPWIFDIFALPVGIQVGIAIVSFFGVMLVGAFRSIRS